MMLAALVLACVAQSACALRCLTPQDDRVISNPAALKELRRSQLDFSLSLMKAVGKQEPTDNVFISPLSIYNALLQAFFVSAGHTERSLHNALFLPKNMDKVNILLSYRLQRHITSTEEYKSQVHTANKLFLSKEQTVQDCVEYYFDDEIQKLDFGGSKESLLHSVDIINNWVANVTKNNIKDLISAENLNPSTQLILANAAYFKGMWKNQFDPQYTRPGKFKVSKDKTVSVTMMYQQNTFSYRRSDNLEAEILELPYKNGDISMIIFVPDQLNTSLTAAALLQRLDRDTLVNFIRESNDPKNEVKLEIKMPKFVVERTLELTPILESLGVGDLFMPTSNLTGLTGGPQIQLNSAVHKAKIQVDEQGTEAAAATALLDTRIPGDTFICDRPFLYLLYDKSQETLLFAGLYNDPTK